jgi:pyridoxine 5-phosphate synthase
MAKLGFNVDHVATLRQARGGREPDPVAAAAIAELAGADGITVHLREDRRHIQDRDVFLLRETVQTKLNLEMAVVPEILQIALDVRPDQATLVPERREEITTEGGLDVVGNRAAVEKTVTTLRGKGVIVSLFIDPEEAQVDAAKAVGADAIELHTGTYANAVGDALIREMARLREAAKRAHGAGLDVHAGHGLTIHNVEPIARLPHLLELNIGHSIVCRAVFVSLGRAVREMAERIR